MVAQRRKEQSSSGVVRHRSGRCRLARPAEKKRVVSPGLPGVGGRVKAAVSAGSQRAIHHSFRTGGHGRDHRVRLPSRGAESHARAAQPAKRQCSTVRGGHQRPRAAAVGGTQNPQAEIRISGIVRLARAHKNHTLRGIGIPRLNRERADRKRSLVVRHSGPGHVVRNASSRIRGFPNSSLRTADIDCVARGVRRIDRYCGSPARNLVVVLKARSCGVGGQRHRAQRCPPAGRCRDLRIPARRSGQSQPSRPRLHLHLISAITQRGGRFPWNFPAVREPLRTLLFVIVIGIRIRDRRCLNIFHRPWSLCDRKRCEYQKCKQGSGNGAAEPGTTKPGTDHRYSTVEASIGVSRGPVNLKSK